MWREEASPIRTLKCGLRAAVKWGQFPGDESENNGVSSLDHTPEKLFLPTRGLRVKARQNDVGSGGPALVPEP